MILSEKQILSIREAESRINIWHGAVRAGKSHASLWAFFHFMRFGPPGSCVIVGRTTHTIIRNIIDPMREILGESVKYLIGRQELDFFGRKVYIIPASDARAEGRVRGSTFVGAYVDEATLIPENFFKMLLSRLSLSGARIFCTTNPDSPLHWLKKDFLDRKSELDLSEWHFKLEDNPSLTKHFIDQIKTEYTGLWYQRLIEGRWVQAEGAIYDFFDTNIHCIDYSPYPPSYYIVGVDYGTTNPFSAILIGINPDKNPNCVVEAEYYFDSKKSLRQKTDVEYADDMVKFLSDKYVKSIYIDPSAASFKLEMIRRGFDNIYDAQNEVIDGIRHMSTYIEQGTLKICRNCQHLIEEIQGYVWDPKSQQLGIDKPLKQNDHALDATRYALFTHFFGKDSHEITASDLERRYLEAYGINPTLPRFFQDPTHLHG